jgi:hypothetical protein
MTTATDTTTRMRAATVTAAKGRFGVFNSAISKERRLCNGLLLGLIVSTVLISTVDAEALPAYRRLWERKYNYSMSCALCHSKGGGSELGAYGHDFQRFGMTPGAFRSIESRDSDGDGSTNLQEIQAKSNPGSSQSLPTNPTDWLEHIESAALPIEQLQVLFPGVKDFSALEGTLLESQAAAIEPELGAELSDEDTVPTFYFAVERLEGKLTRTGVSLFVTPTGASGKLIVAVAVDLTGAVKQVLLVKNDIHKGLANSEFLAQFVGKKVDDPLEVGSDIEAADGIVEASKTLALSVRKALLIVRAVFS